MRSFFVRLAVFGLALIVAPAANAWGPAGHLTVAKVAWDQLKKDQRSAAFNTLKGLPFLQRFLDDHPKPNNVSDQEWLFLIAADWPDWLKDFKSAAKKNDAIGVQLYKFHIENRHFFDIPFKDNFSGDVPKPLKVNIVEALATDVPADLRDDDPAKRAVALCWLLHLIGDVHQPLHCTTRFTDDLPKGDVGGNVLWVRYEGRATELHGFWDDLPGTISHPGNAKGLPAYYEKLYAKVSDNAMLLARPAFARDQFTDRLKQSDPKVWAEESHGLGVAKAYLNGKILGTAITHDTPPHEASELKKKAPELPDEYVTQALATAQSQVALAGHRLADRVIALVPDK